MKPLTANNQNETNDIKLMDARNRGRGRERADEMK